MNLRPVGVWWSGVRRGASLDGETARALEELGYGAIWSSAGFDPGLPPHVPQLLDATDRMVVATGVVSIWVTAPEELARAVAVVRDKHPDRFLLGLGASHAPLVERYERPYSHMVSYLDGLDAARPPVPPNARVLAALGPKMLRLAAARSAGAHPYFVPVEHTRTARQILGTGPLLAPEVTAVLEPDPVRARELARSFTPRYLALPNYANNL